MSDHEKVVSPEHEYLGASKSAAYGLQHVLTMYGGIIAPPLIVGAAAGLSGMQIGLLIHIQSRSNQTVEQSTTEM